jgi:hypothetical protein
VTVAHLGRRLWPEGVAALAMYEAPRQNFGVDQLTRTRLLREEARLYERSMHLAREAFDPRPHEHKGCLAPAVADLTGEGIPPAVDLEAWVWAVAHEPVSSLSSYGRQR